MRETAGRVQVKTYRHSSSGQESGRYHGSEGFRPLGDRARHKQAEVCHEVDTVLCRGWGMARMTSKGPYSIGELAQKPGLALPPPFLFATAK